MTSDLGVRVLVNDRVDIALAAEASGAHVGSQDLPVNVARRLLGAAAVLGATARDATTAKQAMLDGATYVGVGPCFQSSTKDGLPTPLGRSGLAQVTAHAPVIAIGGITLDRVPSMLDAGAHGVAVVAAVADAPDPARALADLLDAVSRRARFARFESEAALARRLVPLGSDDDAEAAVARVAGPLVSEDEADDARASASGGPVGSEGGP
jgi:thiamine-phosphate diphosphorylase